MGNNKDYTIHFISKIRRKAGKFIEKELKDHGIDDLIFSHGSILSVLYQHDRLMLSEIAELVGKDKSTITQHANRLEELNYIKKEKSQEDKRVTCVTLTEKGEAMRKDFTEISEKLISRAYDGFTEEEQMIFLMLLKKLYSNFS